VTLGVVKTFGDVSIVTGHGAFAFRGGGQIVDQILHLQRVGFGIAPADLQGGSAALGGPGMCTDHRNRIIESHHLGHPRQRLGDAVVDLAKCAAQHRTADDHGVLHAG
jgi:hypothetical protein